MTAGDPGSSAAMPTRWRTIVARIAA